MFNYSVTGDTDALTLINVETVNVTSATLAAIDVKADNYSGVDTIKVVRGDVANGAFNGKGAVTVSTLSGDGVTVIAGTKVTDLDVVQATTAGATINANGATGDVTVTGAATLTTDTAGAVDFTAGIGDTDEDAKTVSITANTAASVNVDADFTGAISIDADAALKVTVENAKGGVTITSATGAETEDEATGIVVDDVDASGATIVTGAYTKTYAGSIELGGTAKTTDTASISAAGYVNLETARDNATDKGIDSLTLSGNGAAVTYTITQTKEAALAEISGTGSQSVTVKIDADEADGLVVSGIASLNLNAAAAAAVDLTDVDVSVGLALSADIGEDITVNSGAGITLSKDQTDLTVISGTDEGTLTLTVGDDTADNAAVTLEVAALTLGAADGDFSTVNLVASVGKLTATSVDASSTLTALVVSGTKDVTLGDVTAKSINTTGSTGKITFTAKDGVKSITTGSGIDNVTIDVANDNVFTVNLGNGANVLDINAGKDGSTFVTGSGADTINIDDADSFSIQGGTGNDTYNISVDSESLIADESGTADAIVTTGALDLGNSYFGFSGIESFSIDDDVTARASAFSGQTLEVVGTAGDVLTLEVTSATKAQTIDLSGITLDTATIEVGNTEKADTIIGSDDGTTFLVGDDQLVAGDVIEGGSGDDVIDATAAAAALDFTVATITGIESLLVDENLTLQQGTGITSITGDATDVIDLLKATTAFQADAELAAADVNVAGEWFVEDAGADAELTYFDEDLGEVVTVALVGNDGTAVTSVAGNLHIVLA